MCLYFYPSYLNAVKNSALVLIANTASVTSASEDNAFCVNPFTAAVNVI